MKGNSLIFVGTALGLKREVHKVRGKYVGCRTVALSLKQGRNWLPKTGGASNNAAPSILPKSGRGELPPPPFTYATVKSMQEGRKF